MTRTAHLGRLTGALMAAGLLLTSCSSTPEDTAAGSSTSDEQATRDDADVTFAQGMLPHHQQAVQMAELATTRAADPRVLDLASRITAAQGPEIATLTRWLEDWGADSSSSAGAGGMTGMDGGGSMGGMMSDTEMTALQDASGAAFDTLFLQQMVTHHTGAVDMAQTEIDEGRNADAIAMATGIRTGQTAEITEMQQLLTSLGG